MVYIGGDCSTVARGILISKQTVKNRYFHFIFQNRTGYDKNFREVPLKIFLFSSITSVTFTSLLPPPHDFIFSEIFLT